ncbi:hypothetical protein O181_002909 [Austropuccinia psidii MF-1]|uniref:Uncharacterized protein n=1 Tax=Austropuccinia psidii MF-1 TaxID=1389203 RepID=A0A9Q3GDB5_9BASI|nr:hypothetical protein [Austropuccinia psidii MF-1]
MCNHDPPGSPRQTSADLTNSPESSGHLWGSLFHRSPPRSEAVQWALRLAAGTPDRLTTTSVSHAKYFPRTMGKMRRGLQSDALPTELLRQTRRVARESTAI